MTIAIVDYGMGNLHSVSKAIERLGYEAQVTSKKEEIMGASGVVLPGVGAYGDAMQHLRETELDKVMREVQEKEVPLLGICLGMQLLFSSSEEHGQHEGLNIIPGRVVRFEDRSSYKVPHMGWNELQFIQQENPLFQDLTEGHVYFVHSYHVEPEDNADLLAVTDYGFPVTAIAGRGSVYGMQFHPEKSGELGMQLLKNFLKLAESSS